MQTTPEFMASRWWERATEADRAAMRALVVADAMASGGQISVQLPLELIDKSDLFGAANRVPQ